MLGGASLTVFLLPGRVQRKAIYMIDDPSLTSNIQSLAYHRAVVFTGSFLSVILVSVFSNLVPQSLFPRISLILVVFRRPVILTKFSSLGVEMPYSSLVLFPGLQSSETFFLSSFFRATYSLPL